jgi:hypothetical protein
MGARVMSQNAIDLGERRNQGHEHGRNRERLPSQTATNNHGHRPLCVCIVTTIAGALYIAINFRLVRPSYSYH